MAARRFLGSILFTIEAEIVDPTAKQIAFREQNSMYSGIRVAKGDTIFAFASISAETAASPNEFFQEACSTMDLKLFATVFSTVFVAELGDKTQLATLLYASDGSHPKWTVFAASATALVLTSALGVLGGALLAEYVSPKLIRWVAGVGFILVGVGVLLSRD